MFSGKSSPEAFIELAMTSLVFAALLFLIGLKSENNAPRRSAPISLESIFRASR